MPTMRPSRRTGPSALSAGRSAQELAQVRIMPDCADDGSLLAIIDDDIGLPIEVCLIDGIFIAARGGFSFFETRRFEDMIAALNQEIDDCWK